MKISDFGLARFRNELIRNDLQEIVGTPYWMAPEAINMIHENPKSPVNPLKNWISSSRSKENLTKPNIYEIEPLIVTSDIEENPGGGNDSNTDKMDLLSMDPASQNDSQCSIRTSKKKIVNQSHFQENILDFKFKEDNKRSSNDVIKQSNFSFKRNGVDFIGKSDDQYLYSFGFKNEQRRTSEKVRKFSELGPGLDIWSVGCTVLECLTGNPPYHDLIHV